MLNTFDLRQVTSANATATTEFCFESDGFLSRTRVLRDTARSAKDLLTVFEPDLVGGVSTGFVAGEKLYGGDDQASMDSVYTSLCDMTLPARPKYQTDHTYAFGVRASSTAVDPCDGGAVLSRLDRTIDPATGLVAASRDPAGVAVAFDYDANGRLITEKPDASAWIAYDYQLPTQASPTLQPRLTVQSCPNGSATCTSSAALTWSRVEFDGLGRQIRERLRLPGIGGILEPSRATTYNAQGLKATESAWGDESKVTTFEGYDPFGRPATVTPPGQPATEFTYLGERVTTRRTRVMTASNTLQDADTTRSTTPAAG